MPSDDGRTRAQNLDVISGDRIALGRVTHGYGMIATGTQ